MPIQKAIARSCSVEQNHSVERGTLEDSVDASDLSLAFLVFRVPGLTKVSYEGSWTQKVVRLAICYIS